MLRDLEAVVGAGVDHLTHYELNVGGRTDFALNRSHELPSVEETLEMYRTARDFLTEKGYRQVTTYDWGRSGSRSPQLVYEEEWRHRFAAGPDGTVTGSQTWGWGFAGISHFFGDRSDRGWTYMNHTRVADYFKALDAGSFPVERGFRVALERPDLLCWRVRRRIEPRVVHEQVRDAPLLDEVSCRSVDRSAVANERVWVPTSRWLTRLSLRLWITSIGSSSEMMCREEVRLM